MWFGGLDYVRIGNEMGVRVVVAAGTNHGSYGQ